MHSPHRWYRLVLAGLAGMGVPNFARKRIKKYIDSFNVNHPMWSMLSTNEYRMPMHIFKSVSAGVYTNHSARMLLNDMMSFIGLDEKEIDLIVISEHSAQSCARSVAMPESRNDAPGCYVPKQPGRRAAIYV